MPSCGPSCKEGLLDTLGRNAPNVSGSAGTTLVSGPGMSFGDGTSGVRVPGISSILRSATTASRSNGYDGALSVSPCSECGPYPPLPHFSDLNHVSPSPLVTAFPPRPQLFAALDPGQEG